MLSLTGCWLLLGVVFWQLLHILPCFTKPSTYIAHFTGDGHFLIRSLMNTNERLGDRTPPCDTPCLKSIFLLFVLYTTTLALRLCIYYLIHRNIFPAILHFFSFRISPSVHTLSNVFCRSIHTVSVCFLSCNPTSNYCARYVVWSSVQWCSWKPACSEKSNCLDSRNHYNLVLIILSSCCLPWSNSLSNHSRFLSPSLVHWLCNLSC